MGFFGSLRCRSRLPMNDSSRSNQLSLYCRNDSTTYTDLAGLAEHSSAQHNQWGLANFNYVEARCVTAFSVLHSLKKSRSASRYARLMFLPMTYERSSLSQLEISSDLRISLSLWLFRTPP